ncbi:MAG: hypothetical protein M1815_005088 [Lichina confinis]|nr:MAG: hypothetical protein M1815_005088 [Lichina confinis]
MAFDTLAMLSGFDGAMKKDRKADVTRYAAVERDCVEAARKETKTVPALRVEPKYLQLLSYRFATDNRGLFEAAKAKVKQTRPQSQQQQLGPQGDTRPLLPMDKAVGAVKNGWNNVFGGGAGGRR